jgi:hypothetical protein
MTRGTTWAGSWWLVVGAGGRLRSEARPEGQQVVILHLPLAIHLLLRDKFKQ